MYIIKNSITGKYWHWWKSNYSWAVKNDTERNNYLPHPDCWHDKPRVFQSVRGAVSTFPPYTQEFIDQYDNLFNLNDKSLFDEILPQVIPFCKRDNIDIPKTLQDIENTKIKWLKYYCLRNRWQQYIKNNKFTSIDIAKLFEQENFLIKKIRIS